VTAEIVQHLTRQIEAYERIVWPEGRPVYVEREPRLDFGHPVDWPQPDGWDDDDDGYEW
jgi:hypothetical protein